MNIFYLVEVRDRRQTEHKNARVKVQNDIRRSAHNNKQTIPRFLIVLPLSLAAKYSLN